MTSLQVNFGLCFDRFLVTELPPKIGVLLFFDGFRIRVFPPKIGVFYFVVIVVIAASMEMNVGIVIESEFVFGFVITRIRFKVATFSVEERGRIRA